MRRGRGLADRGLRGRSRRARGALPPSLMRSSVKSFFSLPLIHKMSFRCKPSAESSLLAGIMLLYGVDAGIAACERHRPKRLSIQRVRWNDSGNSVQNAGQRAARRSRLVTETTFLRARFARGRSVRRGARRTNSIDISPYTSVLTILSQDRLINK